MQSTDYVKASEIQEYVYCKRAWWLKLHGNAPVTEQMKAGTLAHEQMARSVYKLDRLKIAVYIVVTSLVFLSLLYVILRYVLSL